MDDIKADLVATIAASGRKAEFEDGQWILVEIGPRLIDLAVEYSASTTPGSASRLTAMRRDAHRRLERTRSRPYLAIVQKGHHGYVLAPQFVELVNQAGDRGGLIEATPTLRQEITKDEYGVFYIRDVVRPCDATYVVQFRDKITRDGTSLYTASFTFDATNAQAIATIAAQVRGLDRPEIMNARVSPVSSGLSFYEASSLMLQVIQVALML